MAAEPFVAMEALDFGSGQYAVFEERLHPGFPGCDVDGVGGQPVVVIIGRAVALSMIAEDGHDRPAFRPRRHLAGQNGASPKVRPCRAADEATKADCINTVTASACRGLNWPVASLSTLRRMTGSARSRLSR